MPAAIVFAGDRHPGALGIDLPLVNAERALEVDESSAVPLPAIGFAKAAQEDLGHGVE
jgi:hypothetical protein